MELRAWVSFSKSTRLQQRDAVVSNVLHAASLSGVTLLYGGDHQVDYLTIHVEQKTRLQDGVNPICIALQQVIPLTYSASASAPESMPAAEFEPSLEVASTKPRLDGLDTTESLIDKTAC